MLSEFVVQENYLNSKSKRNNIVVDEMELMVVPVVKVRIVKEIGREDNFLTYRSRVREKVDYINYDKHLILIFNVFDED